MAPKLFGADPDEPMKVPHAAAGASDNAGWVFSVTLEALDYPLIAEWHAWYGGEQRTLSYEDREGSHAYQAWVLDFDEWTDCQRVAEREASLICQLYSISVQTPQVRLYDSCAAKLLACGYAQEAIDHAPRPTPDAEAAYLRGQAEWQEGRAL
jgi:hypothetical protein